MKKEYIYKALNLYNIQVYTPDNRHIIVDYSESNFVCSASALYHRLTLPVGEYYGIQDGMEKLATAISQYSVNDLVELRIGEYNEKPTYTEIALLVAECNDAKSVIHLVLSEIKEMVENDEQRESAVNG
jgi:hypothetical protein